MERARTVLEKALAISPESGARPFLLRRASCARTATTTAPRKHLRSVLAQYPRDRVALNDLGRVLFLQRKYADAVKSLAGGAGDRSRRPAGTLQPDALLQRTGRREDGEGTSGALPALQSGRVVADDYRHRTANCIRKTTTSGRRSTSTCRCRCRSRAKLERPRVRRRSLRLSRAKAQSASRLPGRDV